MTKTPKKKLSTTDGKYETQADYVQRAQRKRKRSRVTQRNFRERQKKRQEEKETELEEKDKELEKKDNELEAMRQVIKDQKLELQTREAENAQLRFRAEKSEECSLAIRKSLDLICGNSNSPYHNFNWKGTASMLPSSGTSHAGHENNMFARPPSYLANHGKSIPRTGKLAC